MSSEQVSIHPATYLQRGRWGLDFGTVIKVDHFDVSWLGGEGDRLVMDGGVVGDGCCWVGVWREVG